MRVPLCSKVGVDLGQLFPHHAVDPLDFLDGLLVGPLDGAVARRGELNHELAGAWGVADLGVGSEASGKSDFIQVFR